MPAAPFHDNLIPSQNSASTASISGDYTATMRPYPTGNFTDYYSDSSTNHPESTSMSTPSFSDLPRESAMEFTQDQQQPQPASLQMQQISQDPSQSQQRVDSLQPSLQQTQHFHPQQYLLQQPLDGFQHNNLSGSQIGIHFSHGNMEFSSHFSTPHVDLKSQSFPPSSSQNVSRASQLNLVADGEGISKTYHSRSSSVSTRASDSAEYIKIKKPRVETTYWEDEKTICYQVEARGVLVSRREDDNYVNGTKLLNATQMTRGKRDGILKTEKNRNGKVVKVGSMNLKGIWIPFERALEIARNEGIEKLLYPLFVKDLSSFYKNRGKYLERNDSDGSGEDELDTDNPHIESSLTSAPSSGGSNKPGILMSPHDESGSELGGHQSEPHTLPDDKSKYYDQSIDFFRPEYTPKSGEDVFGTLPGLVSSITSLSSHVKKERA